MHEGSEQPEVSALKSRGPPARPRCRAGHTSPAAPAPASCGVTPAGGRGVARAHRGQPQDGPREAQVALPGDGRTARQVEPNAALPYAQQRDSRGRLQRGLPCSTAAVGSLSSFLSLSPTRHKIRSSCSTGSFLTVLTVSMRHVQGEGP